ncbi:MAG: hypothetical protein WC848_06290 [Parcubacteria group bacterium]|jgi:hypothetical protein
MAKGVTTAYSAGKVNQLRIKVREELEKGIDPAGRYILGNMAYLTREAIERVLIAEYEKSLGEMELSEILKKFVLENKNYRVMLDQ